MSASQYPATRDTRCRGLLAWLVVRVWTSRWRRPAPGRAVVERLRLVRGGSILVCAAALSACEDVRTPLEPDAVDAAEPARAAPALIAADGPPEDTPEEFHSQPHIFSTRLEVGFEYGETKYAYAIATMDFWANRARQTVDLSISRNGYPIARAPQAVDEWGMYLPMRKTLATTSTLATDANCGYSLDAQSQHRAWHEYRNWNWGTDQASNSKPASQPSCSTGGAADPGSGTVCYTVTTDHYWYYPDTGTYEYRYSESRTYCYQNAE